MLVTGNNPSNAYRLSIRVFTGGFSLSVYQGGDTSPLEQESVSGSPGELAAQLRAALARPHYSNYSFQQVEIISCAPSTRIPLERFQREEITATYRLTFPGKDYNEKDIRYEILKELEVVDIFPLSQEIVDIVSSQYPAVQVHSQETLCLESDRQQSHSPSNKAYCFFAHILTDQLFVSTFHRGKLQFACSYPVKIDSDRLYFILYAWKTLGMQNAQTQCILSRASAKLIEELGKYILYIHTCA